MPVIRHDRRHGWLQALAAVLFVGMASPLVAQQAGATRKVLVVGIDGVRPDVLAQVSTPNLDVLIAEGAYSDRARTGLPTVSGPGWSSMLIGAWPDKHGVTSNDFSSNRYDAFPDFLTRIEQVRPELNTFVVADWRPLVAHEDGGPLIGDRVDVRVSLNGYIAGWAAADESSVRMAAAHLRFADPDAGFVYLGNPDETSHQANSIDREYRAAIALADRHVGILLASIRERPTYASENWLILVSTDHGRRVDGGHGGESEVERTIFYLASGPDAISGTLEEIPQIVDVAVTALAHLGIAIDADWQLDGRVVGLRTVRGAR